MYDEQGLPDIKVGDYVQVLSGEELELSPMFHSSGGSVWYPASHVHISGYRVDEINQDREGYVKSIDDTAIPVLYILDSGPRVPYDALKLVRHSKRCECGKEKLNFSYHMFFCPKYERF